MSGRLDHPFLHRLNGAELVSFEGDVAAIGQNRIEATGPYASVGDLCSIENGLDDPVLAQVVAVESDRISLLPLSSHLNVGLGARVVRQPHRAQPPAGEQYAGRAIDAFGKPIDGGIAITADSNCADQAVPGKLDRLVLPERVVTGIRAIDGLIPLAIGQRIGVFAASGVGKTSLLEQLSKSIVCDHCILCLIGERGREAERLWRVHSSHHTASQATMVAATSEESPAARIRAMDQALALAEYWRSRGRHVVLFVDSVTRLAMALREVGLSAGEPPSLRSYTPNVFARMPNYVERCGAIRNSGSITAVFTILAETDDVDDPIVELLKSLLDGHIVLSRKLADRAHYPAIDLRSSISRVANELLDEEELQAAAKLRKVVAELEESRLLVDSGIYREGTNDRLDRAIKIEARLADFLQQDLDEFCNLDETGRQMIELAKRC